MFNRQFVEFYFVGFITGMKLAASPNACSRFFPVIFLHNIVDNIEEPSVVWSSFGINSSVYC